MTATTAAKRVRKSAPSKTIAPRALTPQDAPLPPLFAWVGGKTWAARMLIRMVAGHEHRRHVELFAGALGVGLALRPRQAVINDRSVYLINLYRQIQAGTMPPRPKKEMTQAEYIRQRDLLETLFVAGQTHTPEFADVFLTVMRGLFSAYYAERDNGVLVKKGWNLKAKVGQEQDWQEYKDAFIEWIFTCGPWEQTPIQPGDLVIADPPYHGTWQGYAKDGYPYFEQGRLADKLLHHDGPVVLHNDAGMTKVYREYGFEAMEVPRNQSGRNGSKEAVEVVAVRGLPLPDLHDVMHPVAARAWLNLRALQAKGLAATPPPKRRKQGKKSRSTPIPAPATPATSQRTP